MLLLSFRWMRNQLPVSSQMLSGSPSNVVGIRRSPTNSSWRTCPQGRPGGGANREELDRVADATEKVRRAGVLLSQVLMTIHATGQVLNPAPGSVTGSR
jgi:hypothetical protein